LLRSSTPDLLLLLLLLLCWLQVFWECGGTLAAPAIASGVIHKVLAFVAPKIIGGARAPTPVGELGNVEMTQVCGCAVLWLGMLCCGWAGCCEVCCAAL
jgi:riboflavin biosynthesis pyrimidine reductase